MRGTLETIVGGMFAGKTSELLKRILWAKHQEKKILVIKPSIDDRYSEKLIITHNNLSHECYAMKDWDLTNKDYILSKKNYDVIFLDEIQFMHPSKTIDNIENLRIPVFKLVSTRFSNTSNIATFTPAYGWEKNEVVWVDYDESQLWAAYRKNNPWD